MVMTRPSGRHVISLAVSVLAVAAVLYWLANDRRAGIESALDQPAHATAPVSTAPTPSPSPSPSPASGPAPPAHRPQSAANPLWRTLDQTAVKKLPPYAAEWSTEGRALVRVAGGAAAARAWRVGDPVTIPVPQLGATYRAVIDEIDDGPGYSRSALGMVTGADGRPRRYVVTVGPTSMFAFIDTPEGAYELVAGREFGWLLPTASMMAGFDFSEPDYILPETTQHPGPSTGEAEDTGTAVPDQANP